MVVGVARFIIRRLAVTGPKVPTAELLLADGLNIIWGASNTGKSFTVKLLDFLSGAKPKMLPNINERQGYEKAWLDLILPKSGQVTLVRALAGGSFGLYDHWVQPGTEEKATRTLSPEHKGKDNLSAFLLAEIGIADKSIARTQNGAKAAFSLRHFVPYLFTEETDMMGEWSPIRISDFNSDTLDKNVLKFITTGVDDSAVIETPSIDAQKSINSGKIQMVDEMLASAEQELNREYPEPADLESQLARLDKASDELHSRLIERQNELDQLRHDRRFIVDSMSKTQERQTELVLALERFALLKSIYDSDVERLSSLEEGGAALMATANRPCPLCGADPEHQKHAHGLEEVEQAQRAVRAEIAKIELERSDLMKATSSLRVEQEGLARRAERLESDLQSVDGRIAEVRPRETAIRSSYEEIARTRDNVRVGLSLAKRVEALRQRKGELDSFKASKVSKSEINVGVGGVVGHELAMAVQSVLRAWRFPGDPSVSFDDASHDILVNGKDRRSNGKGVRALLNAAFKIGLLDYCRQKELPHPGVLVLDSPLLTYRQGQKSRHGELSEDEKAIKASGVKERFFVYLKEKSAEAQFIIIENDPPPDSAADYATIYSFVGNEGEEGRKGFF
ncbi:hypothetical protein [Bradyrhizobium iriomotense]|uniref:Rad50/SbcC-type AAA domain-containing protein n=1 Tax=Bradyrhizobium iriomotense TaxID=441950 RepID=A0ABQ6B818_9BRAD|nr:hypothetical protein [Bradyrhizobium iriomotense]GLR88202.1 hypothetical protein GCM10007857_49140 [Bradyrhizobium iriomotense]